ncbi:MAG TPA: ATP-binding protein [Myxococcota bacterium]|jgi:two-component system phosphate regulon sensor histidine kinase PhoR
MRSRAQLTATVVGIALAAWSAAQWAPAAHGNVARVAVVLVVSTGLALWVARNHFGRLAEIRAALESSVAGTSTGRLARAEPGAIGALARTAYAVDAALQARVADARAERERLMAVLDGMIEGVLVVDREGRVELANARLRELFECWGELAGRRTLEVIRRADVAAALERAAAESEPVIAEVDLAEERVLQLHAHRFPAKGEREGVVAVFHDVGEIRRLESHRREFVANVSHELRTPLTAIRGFAETLGSEGLAPEQRKRFVEVIARNAERLSALIEDLLELSRIEGGKRSFALEAVDPAALASTLLRDMRPRLEARSLVSAVSGGGELVLADRRALEQVLQNLLDNAATYTEPGGRIEVRVASDGARVRIEVADTGIGIPERDRARVFERFYRVDKARSRDLGGTGLGLAIVKHLVQAMDGDVFLASREGEGTAFTVVLPAAPHPA